MTISLSLLTWPQVEAKGVPYSRVHVGRLEAAGEFPARLQLSKNRVAWIESEIDDWILSRARGPLPFCEQADDGRRKQLAAKAADSGR